MSVAEELEWHELKHLPYLQQGVELLMPAWLQAPSLFPTACHRESMLLTPSTGFVSCWAQQVELQLLGLKDTLKSPLNFF